MRFDLSPRLRSACGRGECGLRDMRVHHRAHHIVERTRRSGNNPRTVCDRHVVHRRFHAGDLGCVPRKANTSVLRTLPDLRYIPLAAEQRDVQRKTLRRSTPASIPGTRPFTATGRKRRSTSRSPKKDDGVRWLCAAPMAQQDVDLAFTPPRMATPPTRETASERDVPRNAMCHCCTSISDIRGRARRITRSTVGL